MRARLPVLLASLRPWACLSMRRLLPACPQWKAAHRRSGGHYLSEGRYWEWRKRLYRNSVQRLLWPRTGPDFRLPKRPRRSRSQELPLNLWWRPWRGHACPASGHVLLLRLPRPLRRTRRSRRLEFSQHREILRAGDWRRRTQFSPSFIKGRGKSAEICSTTDSDSLVDWIILCLIELAQIDHHGVLYDP